MEGKTKIKQNYENNDFEKFYLKEVYLHIQLLFLDLIYDLKPKKTDFCANSIEIYDINESKNIENPENKYIYKQIIKKEDKLIITLKKKYILHVVFINILI